MTRLLCEASNGRKEAMEEVWPLIYQDLRSRAARFLNRERGGHTLQPTALVHEAYLRLIDQRHVTWQNRSHFLAIAAQAMRRILIDWARSHHRVKRGGADEKVSLDDVQAAVPGRSVDLIALDDALTRLASVDARQAQLVELRYFGGLTVEEAATALDVSAATARRDWTLAKAWLRCELSTGGSQDA